GLPRVRRGRAHRAARSARPTLPADAGTICRMPVPLPHPTVPPAHTHLLSPLALGPFEVRNRIVMGSMHVGLEDRPADAKKLAAYLGERARGGAGLIVTGGYSPDRTGRLTPGGGQADARTMRGHRVVTREVHEADGRILLPLPPAGRYAFHPLAASSAAGKSPLSPFRARRMTRRGVRRTVEHFAEAAHRAIGAGYDGVEIMGSEGYLLNQFLAPATNRRRDRWGRGAEGRRALPLAVAAAVREAIGEDALLSYRISLLDLVPGGQTSPAASPSAAWTCSPPASAGTRRGSPRSSPPCRAPPSPRTRPPCATWSTFP